MENNVKELKCLLKRGISKNGKVYFYYEITVCSGFVKKVFINPFTDGAEVALVSSILK